MLSELLLCGDRLKVEFIKKKPTSIKEVGKSDLSYFYLSST